MWAFLVITAFGCLYTIAYATKFWPNDYKSISYKEWANYFNNYYGTNTYWYKTNAGSLLGGYDWADGYTCAPADLIDTAEVITPYRPFMRALNNANNYLFISQFFIICLFAVMCILGNKYRKKYYIGNLVGGIAVPVIAIVLCIVGIVKNNEVLSKYKDAEVCIKAFKSSFNGEHYSPSMAFQTGMLVILIIEIVYYLFIMAYTILKFVMVKDDSNDMVEVSAADVADSSSDLSSVKEAE